MSQTERPAWVPERLFPFESRFVDLDGCRVHFIDEGSGPTLLFLHGNPTWSFLYRNIISRLRDRYRCIALDYPGFGLSTPRHDYGFTAAEHARVVEALLGRLGLSGITMMGQDWGGPIGLAVAGRQPEAFAGFVLGNTWAWPLNGDLYFEAAARAMSNPLARLVIVRWNAFVNVMIPLGTRTKPSREVMDAYRGPFRDAGERKPTAVFPQQLLGSRAFMDDVYRSLPQIAHLPVLFTWGRRDFALRARVELPKLQALFPHHDTLLLDAKHFIQEDAPAEIADAIGRWHPENVVSAPS